MDDNRPYCKSCITVRPPRTRRAPHLGGRRAASTRGVGKDCLGEARAQREFCNGGVQRSSSCMLEVWNTMAM